MTEENPEPANLPESSTAGGGTTGPRHHFAYLPSSFQRGTVGSVWRDPIAWISGTSIFVLMSIAVARKYGSWEVLITEGFVLPIGIVAVAFGLISAGRRHVEEVAAEERDDVD